LLSLLEERVPFEHITIKDIADRANIRRATFYAHYRNKTHLIEEKIDEFGLNLTRQLQVRIDSHLPRSVVGTCEKVFDLIVENNVLLRILNSPRIDFLFVVRMFRLLRKHYRASQVRISFDHELYVHYVSGVMLELILTKARFTEEAHSLQLTADKLVRLLNQKEYEFALL
jgi:AcrR family transcriptional regulator